jgi:hypothetical protein
MDEPKWLLLFPYLPLSQHVEIGRWALMPIKEFKGP